MRETLAAAAAHAAQAREAAREAASQDASLAAALAAELAASDATEWDSYARAKDEVYVGFHELGSGSMPAQASLDPPSFAEERPPLQESDIPPELAVHLFKENAELLRSLHRCTLLTCSQPSIHS